jgi:hypothetical protein
MVSTHFLDAEPTEVDKPDAAGQGFRNAFRQMRRCRTKEKEAGGVIGPIRQHPEQFEQVWAPLDFVYNDQTGEVLQCPHGGGQSLKVNRVFQIEVAALFSLRHDPGKSSLATLSWT